jgi:diguanylate cyclase (GGDEF)-like protein
VVLMSDLGTDAAALVDAAVARLAELQRVPVRIGRAELAITISIGVALSPDDGADEVTLLAAADARMYEAKARRRMESGPARAPGI